jgi:N-acyl amino acid synthase of PEP-CTERM/exosortase system
MATSAALQQQAFGIRYRVYCEDLNYEPAQNFPDGLERDDFDQHAMPALVTHQSSGMPAGCVRLVQAEDARAMPFEQHCINSVYTTYLEEISQHREQVCEFSRIAVDRNFRRRPGESDNRVGELGALDYSHPEHRSFSLIGVATTLAAFVMADLSGRGQVFAMMAPRLPRLLRRSGFLMEQAGDITEYHGQRALYFTTVERVVEHLRPELRELYNAIHRDFSEQFTARWEVA